MKPNIHRGIGSHSSLRDADAKEPTDKIYCTNLALRRYYKIKRSHYLWSARVF
ncbi:hypothetical protein GXM_06717 [Nostoc sphaeroides CCNUC1]|uniref:Uncharacterized protein n=1 Tax=Nostoc sphaeroides CCNUC1 TaxID=2653204 RepID=A0A5P8W8W7_9NOSO|nr:hypothetical protein GXM_06717 [Nostoc sphaeroides CCNUC1]